MRGIKLDKKNSKKRVSKKSNGFDIWTLAIVITILSIGLVMVYSASSYFSMFEYKNSTKFFMQQSMFGGLGIILMLAISKIDYSVYKNKRIIYGLYGITLVLLLLVFLFPPSKGAYRWIKIAGMSFQPSELAKYVVVLTLGYMITKNSKKIKTFRYGVIPCFIVAGLIAGIILAQKNLSIAGVTLMVSFAMIYIGGAKRKHMFCYILPMLVTFALVFALGEDYRRARMLNFIDPWKDAAGNGFQLIQSFYALGSGGVTGLGLGQSRQKTMYMPEPHNDFIFSIIGEELGYIGCITIMILFALLIWRGLKIASEAKDLHGCLLATGITAIIGVQCIINIAVVTGSMPVTGVPLPFISYGGSALVINLMAMGVLLNISRNSKVKAQRMA